MKRGAVLGVLGVLLGAWLRKRKPRHARVKVHPGELRVYAPSLFRPMNEDRGDAS